MRGKNNCFWLSSIALLSRNTTTPLHQFLIKQLAISRVKSDVSPLITNSLIQSWLSGEVI